MGGAGRWPGVTGLRPVELALVGFVLILIGRPWIETDRRPDQWVGVSFVGRDRRTGTDAVGDAEVGPRGSGWCVVVPCASAAAADNAVDITTRNACIKIDRIADSSMLCRTNRCEAGCVPR